MQPEKDMDRKKPGALSFTSRLVLGGGVICLSPLLIVNALSHYTRGIESNPSIIGSLETNKFVAMILFLFLSTVLVTVLILRDEPSQAIPFLMTGGILILALYLRAACINTVTPDYSSFLSPWVSHMRENGGFASLGTLQSDYNLPYLYLLALISYLPVDDLLLIKFISIAGDFLIAYAAMALAREMGLNYQKRLFVLTGVLFAPTIWLNSAYWAQCDVLYALFALLCFVYILRGRPWHAVCMAGLAFAFKLQVIFFLPMLIVFLITRKLKWKHFLAFPGVYLLLCLPGLLTGRSLLSMVTIYTSQVGQYSGFLNLNSPSAYAFVSMPAGSSIGPFFTAGLAVAAVFLLYILYWLTQREKPISNRTLLTLALLFCTAIPWCLPSMHERYFFMADVLVVIYAAVHPKRLYLAPMMIAASYAGYHGYLMGAYLPFPLNSMMIPSLLVATVAVLTFMDLRTQLREDALPKKEESVVPV